MYIALPGMSHCCFGSKFEFIVNELYAMWTIGVFGKGVDSRFIIRLEGKSLYYYWYCCDNNNRRTDRRRITLA